VPFPGRFEREFYAALTVRSSTSLHSLVVCLGNKKRDLRGAALLI